LTLHPGRRIVEGTDTLAQERTLTLLDVAKLALITVTPTLIGAVIIFAPRWFGYLAEHWPRRADREPKPIGPPIEQLAADLRRLLRLHSELTASAHLAMRAHRLWAVEAAIGVRALEAAKALGVPHREPERPGALNRIELCSLLHALGAAGLVLPEKVGPFVGDGRF
jgi:hypothetical protein